MQLVQIHATGVRAEVDELDIDKLSELAADKLKTVSADLSKLSDVVKKNHVVKKDAYNAKIKKIEDKIPDITNVATNPSYNCCTYYI